MDVPHKSSRPSTSHARRLLLPPNLPPPPIPPALLTRTLKPRKPQPPQQKWIDGGEFALARSSSTSQTRGGAPHRRPSEHSCMQPLPAGPPVLMPYANTGMVQAQDTPCQPPPPPPPPLQARHDFANRGHPNVQAGPASHHHHHPSSSHSCPPSRSNNDKPASDERTRRVSP